jgi:fibronectin type 3 domain-containing protein
VAFSVAFRPQSAGAASTSLSFLSNASDSRASETVAGAGTAAPPSVAYRVALSWQASSSPVAGYYIYRGTTSGGPYSKLNSALDAASSYTDTTVLGGQTYYYVTSSVGANGAQSTYSNQVAVTIP